GERVRQLHGREAEQVLAGRRERVVRGAGVRGARVLAEAAVVRDRVGGGAVGEVRIDGGRRRRRGRRERHVRGRQRVPLSGDRRRLGRAAALRLERVRLLRRRETLLS